MDILVQFAVESQSSVDVQTVDLFVEDGLRRRPEQLLIRLTVAVVVVAAAAALNGRHVDGIR